jgi:hypothetical protein
MSMGLTGSSNLEDGFIPKNNRSLLGAGEFATSAETGPDPAYPAWEHKFRVAKFWGITFLINGGCEMGRSVS